MRLAEGIVLENEKTFGILKFSALRREVKVVNEEGIVTEEIKERTYDLKSKGQGRMIQVSIPAKAGEKQFDYNAEVELVNPVADTVATATFRGAEVDWYIKADDIVIKRPTQNQQKDQLKINKKTRRKVVIENSILVHKSKSWYNLMIGKFEFVKEVLKMNIFKTLGNELSYKDILQLDGAFSVTHINYDKSPIFNGIDGRDISKNSRKDSLSSYEKTENVSECIYSFNGTEKGMESNEQVLLWKNYWLEYINVFDKLIVSSPDSVVTIYVGRQAIELGFKYLILKKTKQIKRTHDLKVLSDSLYSEYGIDDAYMADVGSFCEKFSKYIEGGNVEYFRFPEYRGNTYFAGNRLDIKWLSYNFVLIILKLVHFANLDDEI